MASNHRERVIMFADISGSTRLYELLGDTAARAKVADCLDRMRKVIERHSGQIIKTIGDEILCIYEDVNEAGTAACQLHESMQEDATVRGEQGSIRVRLRIGMHFGSAILENGDVFGDAVNVAARMASMAKADQIITTQDTVDSMPPILRAATRCIDRTSVKGKKDTMDIYELIWQHEDVTRMSTGIVARGEQTAELRLTYHNAAVTVSEARGQVVLGRSKTADIMVEETLASRQHVRIEHRRGKFFIVDQSTNGTYVMQDGRESFLRREEMPLGSNGQISLGRPFKEDPREVVTYSVAS